MPSHRYAQAARGSTRDAQTTIKARQGKQGADSAVAAVGVRAKSESGEAKQLRARQSSSVPGKAAPCEAKQQRSSGDLAGAEPLHGHLYPTMMSKHR